MDDTPEVHTLIRFHASIPGLLMIRQCGKGSLFAYDLLGYLRGNCSELY